MPSASLEVLVRQVSTSSVCTIILKSPFYHQIPRQKECNSINIYLHFSDTLVYQPRTIYWSTMNSHGDIENTLHISIYFFLHLSYDCLVLTFLWQIISWSQYCTYHAATHIISSPSNSNLVPRVPWERG